MVFISEAAPGDPSPVLAEAVSSRHEALRRLGPHLPVRRKVPSPRECARVSRAGGASPPRNPAELPPVSCMAPDLTFNTHFITSITQNLSLLHTDSPFIFRTRTFPALSQIRLQNGLSRARLTPRPPAPLHPRTPPPASESAFPPTACRSATCTSSLSVSPLATQPRAPARVPATALKPPPSTPSLLTHMSGRHSRFRRGRQHINQHTCTSNSDSPNHHRDGSSSRRAKLQQTGCPWRPAPPSARLPF